VKSLKDLPIDKFAIMTVEEIYLCNLYSEISKKCTIRNPQECGFSVFFADPSGHRWVSCCPESLAVPAERWGIKSSDEDKDKEQQQKVEKKKMGSVIKGADKIKLFTKWQSQFCPYQVTWGGNQGA